MLPEEDGTVGKVAVQTEGGGSALLDKAYASATVGQGGDVQTGTTSKEEVSSVFAAALAAKPAGTAFFNLYYKPGKLDLDTKSIPVAENLFRDVEGRQAAEVQVTGYAYFTGPGEGGNELALQRAEDIAEQLRERGSRRVVAAKLIRSSGQKPATIPPGRVRVIVR